MNDAGCTKKGCIKSMLISTIVVALVLGGMEFLIHGVWLKPIYEDTASLWRPQEEMGMSPWCIIRLLVLAFVFTVLYCKCKKSESCDGKSDGTKKHAICFGAVLGLLLGTMMASSYLWMPIPAELGIKWFLAGLIQGIVIGLVLSYTCKKKG